jgi:hypothetical protein
MFLKLIRVIDESPGIGFDKHVLADRLGQLMEETMACLIGMESTADQAVRPKAACDEIADADEGCS